jgi:hypothetical protein
LIRYLVLSDTRNSPHFIVPEGSFPCSESLTSCLYPRPDTSSPCRTIPSLFSHVDKYFQTFSFPQVSLSINVCAFLFLYTPRSPVLLSSLNWSPQQCVFKSTNHEAALYAVSFTLILLLPLGAQYLPQYSVLEDPQPIFFLLCKRPIFISVYNSR